MPDNPVSDTHSTEPSHTQGARKIAPVEVPLSHPVSGGSDRPAAGPNRTTLFALIAAVLLALLVIFVLPELVGTPDLEPGAVETIQPLQPEPLESPWEDAQLAKARREAQDVLNQILEKQQFLEQKQVTLWAQARFQQARANAEEGDMLYRQRNFPESLAAYQATLEQLTSLEQEIPGVISKAITEGLTLIEQGDSAGAAQQFNRVLAIEPQNPAALAGLKRSESLDQVLALINDAERLLAGGELDQAADAYSQAVRLDNQYRPALDGKTRTAALVLARDFNQAMSEGYSALEAGRLQTAEKAFVRATKLRPGDTSAGNALVQARNRAAQNRVNRLLSEGRSAEADEQWHQAVAAYRNILASDNSVIDARVGELRAAARAKLDDALGKLLADPMRLATAAVYRNAEATLRDARGIADPGPRLQRQVRVLQQALTKAATPVAVQFVSDNATQVHLLRVGELGSFADKQLMLKPGNYVVTGVRHGFRDVRVEFQVTGGPLAPVSVICREPV